MFKAVIRDHSCESMACKRQLCGIALNEQCIARMLRFRAVESYDFGPGARSAEATLSAAKVKNKCSRVQMFQNLVHDL